MTVTNTFGTLFKLTIERQANHAKRCGRFPHEHLGTYRTMLAVSAQFIYSPPLYILTVIM